MWTNYMSLQVKEKQHLENTNKLTSSYLKKKNVLDKRNDFICYTYVANGNSIITVITETTWNNDKS